MSTQAIDFSSIGGKPVLPAPVPDGTPSPVPSGTPAPKPAAIDFSSIGGKPVQAAAPSSPYVTVPQTEISESDKGGGAGIGRAGTGFIGLPGAIKNAFSEPAKDMGEEQVTKGFASLYGLPPQVALGLHRLVIAPLVKHHEIADAYEKIAQQEERSHRASLGEYEDTGHPLWDETLGRVFDFRSDKAVEAQHKANMHRIAGIAPMLGPMGADLSEHYLQGDKSGAVTELLTNIVAGKALEIGTKLAAKGVQKIAPKTVNVAGETTPVMAGQVKDAAPIAKKVAAEPSPAIADAQQAAAQRGIENVASDALNKQLEKMQQQGTTEEMVQIKPQDFLDRVGTDSGRSMNPLSVAEAKAAYTRGGVAEADAPTISFDKDGNVISADGRHRAMGASQAGVDRIPVRVRREPTPGSEPAPPARAESFGDAAAQTKAAAQPTFKKLDQLSDGAFSTLQNRINMARKASYRATTVEDMEGAQSTMEKAQKDVQDLIQKHADQFKPNELENAQSAWKDLQVLDDVHGYVEKSFSAPKSVAAKSNLVSRTLDGNKLTANLNSMVDKVPAADLTRVLGPDGLTNLYEIAKLASKPETAASVQTMVGEIANRVVKGGRGAAVGAAVAGPTGAAVGATTDAAGSALVRAIATRPRVADMMLKALRAGTPAKVYGPLIASEIAKSQDEDSTADQR